MDKIFTPPPPPRRHFDSLNDLLASKSSRHLDIVNLDGYQKPQLSKLRLHLINVGRYQICVGFDQCSKPIFICFQDSEYPLVSCSAKHHRKFKHKRTDDIELLSKDSKLYWRLRSIFQENVETFNQKYA